MLPGLYGMFKDAQAVINDSTAPMEVISFMTADTVD